MEMGLGWGEKGAENNPKMEDLERRKPFHERNWRMEWLHRLVNYSLSFSILDKRKGKKGIENSLTDDLVFRAIPCLLWLSRSSYMQAIRATNQQNTEGWEIVIMKAVKDGWVEFFSACV